MREHTNAFDITGQNHQNNDSVAAYTYNFNMTDQRVVRTRWGGNLKLDYKLTEQSRLFVNDVMNKHFEHSNHSVTTWQTNQTVAARDASGNFTGPVEYPGYTKDMTMAQRRRQHGDHIGQSANKNSRRSITRQVACTNSGASTSTTTDTIRNRKPFIRSSVSGIYRPGLACASIAR